MMDEALHSRYGEDLALPGEGNAVWDLLLAHGSVRSFRPDPLPPGTLEHLVVAAQSAATSSNLQTYSILALQDPAHKAAAAELCAAQAFIQQAPLFLVFCADLSRLAFAAEREGLTAEGLDYVELFVVATIDAALAAQNTAVAAESLGLGICYVGAARNRPLELAELLRLPPRVFAMFGMAIGWPEDSAEVKPRLPLSEVLHHETYSADERAAQVSRYDAIMQEVYAQQGRANLPNWSRHSAQRIATAEALGTRHTLRDSLRQRGFPLK